jgi:hypothetical protein
VGAGVAQSVWTLRYGLDDDRDSVPGMCNDGIFFFLFATAAPSLPSNTIVYPEVSGLASWNENCKWYSSLPLVAIVSLFCESV